MVNYEAPGKKRLEVLYVDDEIHMRDSFKQFMEYQFDVNVEAAPSPLIAFDMMKEKEFDAIVSDYQMPEMDGLEFLRKLRSSGSDIPFILFTGRGREEVVIEALNSGADYYMQKGGNPSSLFAELNYYLKLSVEKRRKERQIALTNERLESLIENTSDAFALFDLKGHIISINGAFEKTFGWSAQEAVGMVLPMVPQEEMSVAQQRFEDVVASGKAIHYTVTRLRRNGERFEMITTLTPVKDGRGKVVAIAGIGRDITEMARALAVNERQKEELRVTLASIGDGVIATDRNGVVTFLNAVASKLTGYSETEAVGRPVSEIFHIINEETRKQVDIPVDIVMRKGEIVGMANHTVVVSKQGTERMIADAASPIKNAEGNIVGVVMVFRDATEEKLTERRRSARQAVSDVLASETSEKEALKRIVETVCAKLGFQVGEAWLLDEQDGRLHIAARTGNEELDTAFRDVSLGASFSAGEGLPGKVLETGKPAWIADLSADKNFMRRDAAGASGLKSAFGIPLSNRGKTEGVMIFLSKKALDLDNNMVNTMRDIGRQIGLFIGRLRAENSMKSILHNIQSFVANTPMLIAVSDMKGNLVSVNESFEKTYGWTKDEIIGKSVQCIIPEELRSELKKTMEIVASGGSSTFEAIRMRKDGTRLNMRVTVSPVFDVEGNVTHISTISRDITAEKRAEAELRLKNEVVEKLHELVVVTNQDEEGNPVIIYANPAYSTIYGYSAQEVIGKTLWDMQGEATDSASLNAMYNAYVAGTYFNGELVGYNKNGDQLYLDTTLFPMKNGSDGTKVWVLIQKDITALVVNRESLQKANEKLNLMETINRHDMLNHLQAIEAYTHLVSMSAKDDKLSDNVEKIKNITEMMRRQLSTLKEFQFSGSPRWMSVRTAFMDSIEGIDTGDIEVKLCDKDAEIMADPLFERVFSNLVSNTMKHGGNVRTISVDMEERQDHMVLTYSDDGKGIPAGRKAAIFQPDRERPLHGLKLIRDILEMTHMTIREVGTEGRGAKFEIIVPKENYRIRSSERESHSNRVR